MENNRYMVQILFKSNKSFPVRLWDISEYVKTLKEAQTYKSIIDETVEKAQIVDIINLKIVETLK